MNRCAYFDSHSEQPQRRLSAAGPVLVAGPLELGYSFMDLLSHIRPVARNVVRGAEDPGSVETQQGRGRAPGLFACLQTLTPAIA